MLTGRPHRWISPSLRYLESGDHAQRGRLAAAAGTQEGEAFALFDGQIEIVDGGYRAQRFGETAW